MVTISDVLQNTGIQTEYEHSIVLCVDYSLLTAVLLIMFFVYSSIKDGIVQTIILFADFHNGIIVLLLFWILCLVGMFLHGYFYIKKMNKAINNGALFFGNIIERKISKTPSAISSVRTKFIIQLNNGKIIKTPTYVYVPEFYHTCDVYFYKKKYYFTNFKCSSFSGRNIHE